MIIIEFVISTSRFNNTSIITISIMVHNTNANVIIIDFVSSTSRFGNTYI